MAWGRRLLGGVVGAAYVAAVVLLEIRRPLREGRREPKVVRDGRNLAIAALGGVTLQLLEDPLVRPLASRVKERRWGLLQQVRLPRAVELAAGVALMDYTLYLWHILTHRVPFLWRFHAVHHADLDMDASTAIRFHFGELAMSAPYRAAQVLLFGIAPEVLTGWQTFTFASILFHHSNLELAPRLERRLQWLVTTPRLHGIHHTADARQTNSNWSSGLIFWDRMHGTLLRDVPRGGPPIGVGGFDQPSQVTLHRSLTLPFTRQGDLAEQFLAEPAAATRD